MALECFQHKKPKKKKDYVNFDVVRAHLWHHQNMNPLTKELPKDKTISATNRAESEGDK